MYVGPRNCSLLFLALLNSTLLFGKWATSPISNGLKAEESLQAVQTAGGIWINRLAILYLRGAACVCGLRLLQGDQVIHYN